MFIFLCISLFVCIFLGTLLYEHRTIVSYQTLGRLRQWRRGKHFNISGLPANCKGITKMINFINEQVPGQQTAIVDLGCGDGQALKCISKHCAADAHLIGVELDKDSCKIARRRLKKQNVNIIHADLMEVNWDKVIPQQKGFDCVVFFIYETFWDTNDSHGMMRKMINDIVAHSGKDVDIFLAYMSGLQSRALEPQTTTILVDNNFDITYDAAPMIDKIIAMTPFKHILIRNQFVAYRPKSSSQNVVKNNSGMFNIMQRFLGFKVSN